MSFIEYGNSASVTYTYGTFLTNQHLCPDMLRYEQIGAADGWRGRVVRGFFWLMQAWPVRGGRERG